METTRDAIDSAAFALYDCYRLAQQVKEQIRIIPELEWRWSELDGIATLTARWLGVLFWEGSVPVDQRALLIELCCKRG